jgi:GNAT superfamily N-acetyltransferase
MALSMTEAELTMRSPDIAIRDARDDERAKIRDLTLAAYAEYAEIMAPSAWAGLHEVLLEALASDVPAERIVVELRGELIGSVLLYAPAANAYGAQLGALGWPEVRLLAVAPAARGQGIGAALLDECVRRARASGAASLGLHSSKSMRAAIRMYGRKGFVRDPAHDFQPEGAELVMAFRRDLTEL